MIDDGFGLPHTVIRLSAEFWLPMVSSDVFVGNAVEDTNAPEFE